MELSGSTENYLKAILIISQKQKVVRIRDITNFFSYKVSSVNAAIKNLKKLGLIEHEKYGHIELTEEGEKIGGEIYEKYKAIFNFLHDVLGVKKEISYKETCKIEHAISKETYQLFLNFYKVIKK